MQFTLSFKFIYRYWNQIHTKHGILFSISLETEQKQDRINAVHYSRVINLLFIYI